jgi:hypothetical protein
MRKIRLSSVLAASFRDELERIVFFNPEQGSVAAPLVDSIHRYGMPSIVEEEGCLRFRVDAFGMLQTLYAFDETEPPASLVGVAMFSRVRRASLLVLHIAVHEGYTSQGKWANVGVVGRMIAAVRNAGLRTRGIRTLRILYPHEIRFELRDAPPVPPRRPRPRSGEPRPRPRVARV